MLERFIFYTSSLMEHLMGSSRTNGSMETFVASISFRFASNSRIRLLVRSRFRFANELCGCTNHQLSTLYCSHLIPNVYFTFHPVANVSVCLYLCVCVCVCTRSLHFRMQSIILLWILCTVNNCVHSHVIRRRRHHFIARASSNDCIQLNYELRLLSAYTIIIINK